MKKEKPPTFDGYVNNPEDAEAWILAMNNFFELQNYIHNMKAKVVIFSLRGNTNIWWEDVKRVREIRIDDLNWHEFQRILRKKYLSE